MEWERAKTYVLAILLLLNAALGVLLFMENRRYTITSEQESHIRTILAENHITMYRLPLRNFPPMRPIEVTGFYYDDATEQKLVEIFFPNVPAVERVYTGRLGSRIFQYGNGRLEIASGFIEYRNTNVLAQTDSTSMSSLRSLTREAARRQATDFVSSHFPDFVWDRDFEEGENVRIIFHQKYRGVLVFSNFIELLVTPLGIQQVEMQFGKILGHTGSPTIIFSPDEALLAFTQHVRHITQEEPMTIRRMDLVYFQEYISDQEGPYHAVPFYRIFIEGNEDIPFLINAFTNAIG